MYLAWLAVQCGFQQPTDWYNVRQKHFKSNFGGGLLANEYGFSLQSAVAELYPDYQFLPWLFGGVPQRFWKDVVNRRAYMNWLGEELQFNCKADWYQLTKRSFYKNRGGGLLANYYGDSPQKALREFMPNEIWLAWKFKSVPQNYWQLRSNRMAFMQWLAHQIGIVEPSEWASVRANDFHDHHGGGLLAFHYQGSVSAAIRDYLRDYKWNRRDARKSMGLG